jgi:hypothetical protein
MTDEKKSSAPAEAEKAKETVNAKKAEAAVEAAKQKPGAYVAEGSSVICKKGVVGPGTRLTPNMFSGDGEQIISDMLKSPKKNVVEVK